MNDCGEISYTVGASDRIVSVNANWADFARANNAPELLSICGRELWEFMHDEATRFLYRRVVDHVRSGVKVELTLRCDSPDERRLIELTISPGAAGQQIEFRTRLLASKERPHQPLLDRFSPRSRLRLPVCGWCNKVQIHARRWVELDDAGEFAAAASGFPQVDPVTCPRCLAKVAQVLAVDNPLAPEWSL